MKGYFIELANRSTNRVVFSAATADLSKEAFMKLWNAVGESIHGTQQRSEADRWNQFEMRITPMTM